MYVKIIDFSFEFKERYKITDNKTIFFVSDFINSGIQEVVKVSGACKLNN